MKIHIPEFIPMAKCNEHLAHGPIDIDLGEDVALVRHGRWEQCFEDWRKQIEGDKCSLCGFEHYGTSIRDYLHCPNCGAKMDEEDKNHDDAE